MYQNPTSRVSALLLREIDPRRGNAILKQGIAAVVTGMCRTIFLLRNGRAFACGSNGFGQLGLGNNIDRNIPIPTEITFFNNTSIKSVETGMIHTIFLLRDGRMFAYGANRNGQLGLGDTDGRDTPTEITFFNGMPIESVVAGDDHTIFLLDDGRMFACGNNEYGQLGLGSNAARDTPTEITFLGVSSIFLGN